MARSWHWIRHMAAPCNVAGGCGMTCHVIRPNVRHIGILHLVSVLTISSQNDMSFCTSLRNFILTDHLQQKKMTSYRFSRWRIWAILDFRDPIMGSLKSPSTNSYRSSIETIALICLVFFCILATNRRTDEQIDSTDALSRSRYRDRRLNKPTTLDTACLWYKNSASHSKSFKVINHTDKHKYIRW